LSHKQRLQATQPLTVMALRDILIDMAADLDTLVAASKAPTTPGDPLAPPDPDADPTTTLNTEDHNHGS
jgi:hypothetical protein